MIGLPLVLVLAAVLWTLHKIVTSPTYAELGTHDQTAEVEK